VTAKTWLLTDVERDIYIDQIELGPREAGGSAQGYSVRKRRLRGGLRDGVDAVEVDTGALRFTLLPTRGMGLWRAEAGSLRLGWSSPVRGPVHPQFVPLMEPAGLGWLSGFDELLVRCGLESMGPPQFDDDGRLVHPLHGRIANQSAHRVEVAIDGDTGEIAVTGVVDEARLFHNKLRLTSTVRTRAGGTSLTITDEVTNLSARPGELELLYHINLGRPLLEPGAKLSVPLAALAPRTPRAAEGLAEWDSYGPAEPGFAEQVYFTQLHADAEGQTRALLRNARGSQGVSLRFNTRQLPWFVVWKSLEPDEDGYVTGLEPALNLPNSRSFEKQQGRVAVLAPGAAVRFDLELELHASPTGVERAQQAIDQLQAARPIIHDRPPQGWTAP
jgi:hypothetical protein